MIEFDKVGLNKLFADVRTFHQTFKHPTPEFPTLQPVERVQFRAAWIDEEVEELLFATTVHDQADAYLDILYFAVGGLVELGVVPQPLWDFVQAANMAKLHDGVAVYVEGSTKIKKPEGWEAPEPKMRAEILRQLLATEEGKTSAVEDMDGRWES